MAIWLSNIDLAHNQLQNASMHPTGAAPALPVEGQLYFNTTGGNKKLYYYNNTVWIELTQYSASAGIKLVGSDIQHTNVITAGEFGDTGATRTLFFGGAFTIPYVTYDVHGHITSIANRVITIPSNPNTDTFHDTFTWAGGTTEGPTGSLTGSAATVAYGAIPSASGTASGIVTTGAQSFAGDKTFGNNVIITGNLTVNGTVTTVNTETINLADNIISLNSNYIGSTPTENAGIEVNRGTLPAASFIWNEVTDKWQASADSITYQDILTSGNGYSAYIGDGLLATIPVTHNLGTKDVIVQLYDASTFDTVYADIFRTSANVVTVYFASAPGSNDIRILVTKVGSTVIS